MVTVTVVVIFKLRTGLRSRETRQKDFCWSHMKRAFVSVDEC